MAEESLEDRVRRLEGRLTELEQAVKKPAATGAGYSPAYPRPAYKPAPPSEPIDWEAVAGRWFNRVGIVAIVFGVAFFLKYAFDHRWIGELGRVVCGILFGMAMVYAGDEFCRKKMASYGQGLIGGGIAVLYLSGYASFGYYHLLDQTTAFAFMCLVTVAACAMAIRQNALPVAVAGLLGAFMTPELMSTGHPQPLVLFTYLLVLDLGLAGVSLFQDWRSLNLFALFGTQVYLQGYISSWYRPEELVMILLFASAFWLVFMGASTGYYVREGKPSRTSDVVLAALNAATFFVTVYYRLKPEYHDYLGAVCLGLGAAYAAFATMLGGSAGVDRNLVISHLGLAVVFLTLAVPIQLDLKWITIGWAMEAAMLFAGGFKLDHKESRFMAAGVLLVAALRALVSDTYLAPPHAFLLNQRGLNYAFVLAAIVVCISGYRELADPHPQERGFRSFFGVIGVFLGMWLLSWEGQEFWQGMTPERQAAWFGGGYEAAHNLEVARSFSLSAVWALYGFSWFLYGAWRERRPIRLLSLGIMSLAVLKVFLVDLSFLQTIWRILSLLGLGGVTMAVSYYYQREKRPA